MDISSSKTTNEININQAFTDVLIVGAGLTGLLLACDLQRRGVNFRIIDKSPHYFAGSRGKVLQPRSLELLEDIGILDQILPYGIFQPVVRQYDSPTIFKDIDLSAGLYPTPGIPYPVPLWIPQFQIERRLREYLAKKNKYVELGTQLTDLAQSENMVIVTILSKGQSHNVKCLYLVASDGGCSFVRKLLGLKFFHESSDAVRMLVGDLHVNALDHEHIHLWNKHRDGFVSLTPLPQSALFQYQAQVNTKFEPVPTLEDLQEILSERAGVDIKLYDPAWLSSFNVKVGMVDRSVIGRILIAGDAAHTLTPVEGQGLNTSLQDAWNLGWKLALVLKGVPAKLLSTYQEERLPVAGALIIKGIKEPDKLTSIKKTLSLNLKKMKIGVNYRQSSLSKQATSHELPLKAGDRAPDAPLQYGRGIMIRLYDIFKGPHFSLLLTGGLTQNELIILNRKLLKIKIFRIVKFQDEDDTGVDCFLDAKGSFRSEYGKYQDLIYLVRPDGYIGFIGDTSRVQELINYIDQIIGT